MKDLNAVIGNPEFVKSHVVLRVINTDRNREYLKGKPHKDFLDLSAILEIDISEFIGQGAMCVLQDSNIGDLSTDELFAAAMENEKIVYDSLMNTLLAITGETGNKEDLRDAMGIVVTKPDKLHGASAILHNDTLKEIADIYDDDLVICPSSIHEIICLPASTHTNNRDMIDIVKSINATEVQDGDFLSNNVYYYDRATNEVEFM